jgi:hypothetical protein
VYFVYESLWGILTYVYYQLSTILIFSLCQKNTEISRTDQKIGICPLKICPVLPRISRFGTKFEFHRNEVPDF